MLWFGHILRFFFIDIIIVTLYGLNQDFEQKNDIEFNLDNHIIKDNSSNNVTKQQTYWINFQV